MKAAVVVANEDVQYQEVEEPQVTPGHVKIKVRYSGICGSDIPRVLNHGVHFYPIVLGHEFSGDVVEVGEGVTKVKVGDRVSGAPLPSACGHPEPWAHRLGCARRPCGCRRGRSFAGCCRL